MHAAAYGCALLTSTTNRLPDRAEPVPLPTLPTSVAAVLRDRQRGDHHHHEDSRAPASGPHPGVTLKIEPSQYQSNPTSNQAMPSPSLSKAPREYTLTWTVHPRHRCTHPLASPGSSSTQSTSSSDPKAANCRQLQDWIDVKTASTSRPGKLFDP